MSTPAKKPTKVLIPFDATREQIDKAVEQILGPRPAEPSQTPQGAAMFVLFYDYVDNMLERRGPHRPAHLELVNEFHAAGKLTMAGALTDPVDSAIIVFRDRQSAEAFVTRDPYVANGLVPSHRIREWSLVVGA